MRVIDLLNKIANGEATHFDTKLNDKSVSVRYYNDRNFSSSTDPEMLTIADIIKSLNDEVEIIEEEPRNIEICGSLFKRSEYNRLAGIEEDKKIRKIKVNYSPDIDEEIFYEDGDKPDHYVLGDAGTKLLINKINEIIDKINGGTNGE